MRAAASALSFSSHELPPASAAITRNEKFGMPGISPMRPRMPAATASAFGWPSICLATCWLMSDERDMRVTMIATATDSSSAGICATRPSPIVSSV